MDAYTTSTQEPDSRTTISLPPTMPTATTLPIAPGGIKSYYQAKIEAAENLINQKTQNLRRLEAQRNALNARGKSLRIMQYTKEHIITRVLQFVFCGKSSSCFTNPAVTSVKSSK